MALSHVDDLVVDLHSRRVLEWRVVDSEPVVDRDPKPENVSSGTCGAELGNGLCCLRRRGHRELHSAIAADGRVFDWG